MRRSRTAEDIGWVYVWQSEGYWLRSFITTRRHFERLQHYGPRSAYAFVMAIPYYEPPEMVRC